MKSFGRAAAVLTALVVAAALIFVTAFFAVDKLVRYKQNASGGIIATGSATIDFTSDLIVWRGSFTARGATTQEAYEILRQDAEAVKQFLIDRDVPESEFAFSSVTISEEYRQVYNSNGNYIGTELSGYVLSQRLSIESGDVDNITEISRDITELIASGVNFYSDSPEYYYTGLSELKLQLIAAATADAKQRIDIMAENSGAEPGELLSSSLGTFQITAQNSNDDVYLAGGAYNTWSRDKTIFISVRLHYTIK